MISVILPAYNSERTIVETLKSVNEQTLSQFELVIVNDGSSDGTGKHIHDFKFRDGIKVCIIERENKGFLMSLAEGINLSTGDLIARIDADDIWLPEHLEKCSAFLQEQSDYVLVGSNAYYIDVAGAIKSETTQITEDAKIRKGLLKDNQFIHSSVVFRKDAYAKTNGYCCGDDVAAMHIADYNLWLELSKYGKIANLPDVTVKYRVAYSSMSRNVSKLTNYKARKKMMQKAYSIYNNYYIYHIAQIMKVNIRIFQHCFWGK